MYESFAKDAKDQYTGFWVDNGRYFWVNWTGKRVTFVSSTNQPALQRVVGAQQP